MATLPICDATLYAAGMHGGAPEASFFAFEIFATDSVRALCTCHDLRLTHQANTSPSILMSSAKWPLCIGRKVAIHGLKSRPELNGKTGTIVPATQPNTDTPSTAAGKPAPASAMDVASAPPPTQPPAPAAAAAEDGSRRWHVQLDFVAGGVAEPRTVLAIKARNLTVLVECAWCKAAKPPKELLRCARCLNTRYCSKACQTKDWRGDDVEVPGRAARFDAAYSAPRLPHKKTCQKLACCFICLDNEGSPPPIQSGCGCRGDAGK